MKHRVIVSALGLCLVLLAGCSSVSTPPQTVVSKTFTAQTPVIVSSSQPNWEGTNRQIWLHFNRDINPGSLTAKSFYMQGVTGTYHYDAKNRVAYLVPSAILQANQHYMVSVTSGVRDTSGSALAGYSFAFNTRATTDTSPPTVAVVGQGCTSPNGPVDVRFDETMDSSTITSSTFVVTDASDSPVAGTVSYDASTRIASFTPTSPFAANTTFNATVTTGVQDAGGVALASDFTFQFTTCPAPPPASFCSFTKGGYAGPGTPGQIFTTNFPIVFANDLTLGVNDGGGPLHDARWTAASPGPTSLQEYLTSPALGPSAAFSQDTTNLAATANGQLPEQTAALALNIGFSGIGTMPAGFGHQVLTNAGSLSGATVEDVLAFANYALAGQGLPLGYTFSSLNDLITNLNSSWDNCTENDWGKTHLTAPTN